MNKKTLRDIDFANKIVLVRFDFNVPLENGVITDDGRIKASIKTIQYLQKKNAKIVIFSHLGRIKTAEDKSKKTLAPIAKRLQELLNWQVIFVDQTRGQKLQTAIKNLHNKDLLLVENTRFEDLNNKSESKNNPELAKYWAGLGDVFVNDAFATAHRAHASNVGIASNIKESCVGFLVEKELLMLNKIANKPERPYIAILGGAKVSDKIAVIKQLVAKADKIIIGGGMAYTFMRALGYCVGSSLVEEDKIALAKEILAAGGEKIILPVDYIVTKEFKDTPGINTKDQNIPDNYMGLDIGSKTRALFGNYIKKAKTIFWNGPMGVFEMTNFANGSRVICEAIASVTIKNNVFSLIGGGDSAAAVKKFGYNNEFSFISTGGGASLQYLEDKELPGIAIINDKEKK